MELGQGRIISAFFIEEARGNNLNLMFLLCHLCADACHLNIVGHFFFSESDFVYTKANFHISPLGCLIGISHVISPNY